MTKRMSLRAQRELTRRAECEAWAWEALFEWLAYIVEATLAGRRL